MCERAKAIALTRKIADLYSPGGLLGCGDTWRCGLMSERLEMLLHDAGIEAYRASEEVGAGHVFVVAKADGRFLKCDPAGGQFDRWQLVTLLDSAPPCLEAEGRQP